MMNTSVHWFVLTVLAQRMNAKVTHVRMRILHFAEKMVLDLLGFTLIFRCRLDSP